MRKIIVLSALFVILGLGLYGFQLIIEARSSSAAQGPLTVSINDVTVTEGNTGTINATFTVTISRPIDFPSTVTYATANDTATVADNDYVAATGSVMFGLGQPLTRTINITVNGDTAIEPDETFFVNLLSAEDISIADGQGVCTILNDDAAGCTITCPTVQPVNTGPNATQCGTVVNYTSPTFSVSCGTATCLPTSGSIFPVGTSTVTCTTTAGPGCSFPVTVVDNTPPTMMCPANTTVTAAPGQCSAVANYPTPLANDNCAGATVVCSPPSGSTFPQGLTTVSCAARDASNNTANCNFRVTLIPNLVIAPISRDFPLGGGTGTVEVTAAIGCGWTAISNNAFITITQGASGSGPGPVNYSVAASTAARIGTMTIAGQTFTVIQGGGQPALSINNTVVAEGQSGAINAVLTVSLSSASASEIRVDYQTADGSPPLDATAPDDYIGRSGTLIFPANSTAPMTINIPVNGDLIAEPDEFFFVNLSNAVGATILSGQGECRIVNDDGNIVLPNVSISDATIVEGDSGVRLAVFTVSLSAPGRFDVVAGYETADGTATKSSINDDYISQDSDIVGSSVFPLRFPAGSTAPQHIIIEVNGDGIFELDETFFVNLKNIEFATSTDAQGVCTILNDDGLTAGPKIWIEDVRVREPENGVQNAVFTVRLFPPSSSAVTVDFTTINETAAAPGDFESVTGTLTFPGGSTQPTTPLVIPIKGDGAFEPTEIFFVNLSNAVGAVIKDHQGIAVIDDSDGLPRLEFLEPPGPGSFEALSVTEGDSGTVEAVFVLILRGSSRLRVTVDYSTEEATDGPNGATAGIDYNDKSGTLTFRGDGDRQEIRVQIIGDRIAEQIEPFRVRLSNLRNTFVQGEDHPSRSCQIIDNDRIPLSVCSTDVPKIIPDAAVGGFAGSAESRLTISEDFVVQTVSVGLFIEHSDVSDLEVSLMSPSGQTARLMHSLKTGANIGAGCTPAEFCVVVDANAGDLFPDNGAPPYVGRFRARGEPFHDEVPGGTVQHDNIPVMDKFKGENARGNWTLIVRDLKNGNTGTIRCWCLMLEGGRTICAVQPNAIQVPRFTYITPTATVLLNGAPVRGASVSFTITVIGDDVMKFGPFGPFPTNQNGQAFMTPYTSRSEPNRETRHIIEARVTLNSETLIGRSQVFWYDVICPTVVVGTGSASDEAMLSVARNFRDDVLSKTPRGKKYTQLYYQFSTEAVRIMMFNPMLMLRSREILSRYKPVIQSMVNGQGASLSEGDLDEIDGFLNSFAAKGSDDFQEAIKGICSDLRDPQMHSEFNITVTDGPKRELQASDQLLGIKRIGGIMMLCGFSGLLFLGLTRRKALLKHTKRLMVALLLLAGLANWSYAVSGPQRRNDRALRPASSPTARSAPLSFEANQGQSDSQAKFISRGSGYNLFLSPGEAVMSFRRQESGVRSQESGVSGQESRVRPQHIITDHRPPITDHRPLATDTLRLKLIGASTAPQMSGLNRLSGARNYFIGNDPATWRADVPCFEKVKYESVYPGVDMVYYGQGQKLEYDFIVAPGADPAPIRIVFDGASSIRMDSSGDLVLQVGEVEVRQLKPVAYQEVNGMRRAVPARYVLSEVDRSLTLKTQNSKLKTSQVGFEIGAYDKSRPLIIDPVLTYSTYLGGSGDDEGNSITVDSAGNAYIAGFTDSINFPVSNSSQPVFGGGQQDAFVTKLDPSGALVYSTYLGGNFQDNASGIAVDAEGNAYVTGFTGSINFPVANAMQPTKNGLFNAFVTKLSPGGSIIYSTHLGGSGGDFGSSIAVDSAGNVYLAGVATSPNFPLSQAIQSTPGGAADVYVAKLNPSATQLLFSTYLGGSDNDGATSIALDSAGNVYVTGVTSSPNFPRASALKASHGGGVFDGFVAKLSSSGAQLIYSTYLGGSGEDRAFRIAVDSAGNAYVTGDTDSADFPVAAALQRTNAGRVDAFVTKINPSGASLIYSTYLGGGGIDGGTAITVDAAGNSYVTGFTASINFPSVDPLQQAFGGGAFDAFAAKLSSSGATLDYCTYLGGSGIDAGFGVAVDVAANLYVMGQTDSINFPTANPIQPANGGGPSDVFVSKITAATVSGLRITGATVSGKRLILTGSGFDNGAKILVDGQSQKTANDDQNPSTTLIGKKAGKKIRPGETVTLQVRNPDGRLSPEFHFTRPVG